MLLARFLDGIIGEGDLGLIDSGGTTHRFGNGESPHVTIRLHDRATERRLRLHPRLALGEAFMDGHHPMKDLAPRDIVARAIDTELKRSGADSVCLPPSMP